MSTITRLDQVEHQLEEVTKSRLRILRDGDARSRRFELGLHDGAQQPLVAVQLILQQVLRADSESERLSLVERASEYLQQVMRELRDLALKVPPPVLRERGLLGALTSVAERTSMPVELRIMADERLPSEIEITGYLVATEGITNSMLHGDATHVEITASLDQNGLTLQVSDDGRGGATVTKEGRLRMLIDRAAALGGSLFVDSPPGIGTTLRLHVPTTTDDLTEEAM